MEIVRILRKAALDFFFSFLLRPRQKAREMSVAKWVKIDEQGGLSRPKTRDKIQPFARERTGEGGGVDLWGKRSGD